MSIRLLFLVTMITIGSSYIIPDPDKPIFTDKPFADIKETHIKFKFMFSAAGPSLSKGQIIKVDLTDTGITQFNESSYNCKLHSQEGAEFYVESASGVTNDRFVACRFSFLNTTQTLLKGTSYILSVYFTSVSLDTASGLTGPVSMAVITDNSNFSIFVNDSAIFASVAFFSAESSKYTPITLENSKSSVTVAGRATQNNSVFINDSFSLTLQFTVNDFISRDSTLAIDYDPAFYDGFGSVTAVDISSATNEKQLQGTFSIVTDVPGLTGVRGFGEDLMPGRKFKLVFGGWKAKGKPLSNPGVKVYFLYGNSTTPIAKMNIEDSIMGIKQAILSVTAKNTENDILYSTFSYPVEFSITSNVALDGYLTLYHEFLSDTKLSFIPSTCYFEASTGFGETPVCFPYTYKNTAEDFDGLFFKVKLNPESPFKFTVWVHPEKCGTSYNIASTDYKKVTFSLGIEFFDQIDYTATGSDRFPDADSVDTFPSAANLELEDFQSQSATKGPWSTQFKLAVSTFELDNKCLNALQDYDTGDTRTHYSFEITNESDTNKDIYLLAREYYSLELLDFTTKLTTSDFVINYTDTNGGAQNSADQLTISGATPNYLFGTTKVAASTYVGFSVNLGSFYNYGGNNLIHQIPTDLELNATLNLATPTYTPIKGHLEVEFSKRWFSAGIAHSLTSTTPTYNSFCYLKWNTVKNSTFNASSLSTNISFSSASSTKEASYQAFNPDNANLHQSNTVLFESTSGGAGNIDFSSTVLPSSGSASSAKKYVIAGLTNLNGGTSKYRYTWPVLDKNVSDNEVFKLGVFTSCLTWNSALTTKKNNLFEHFDFQMKFYHAGTGNLARMIRVLTFVTDLNSPFYSVTKQSTSFTHGNQTTSHYTLGTLDSGYQSICVTTVPSSMYASTSLSSQNMNLVISLYKIIIFETDYASYDNAYPIGNMLENVKAYGFSSHNYLSIEDFRTVNEAFSVESGSYQRNDFWINKDFADFTTFGSRIWFKGPTSEKVVGTTSSAQNILIPHYCPESVYNGTTHYMTTPFMTITWLTSSSYEDVVPIQRHVANDGTNDHNSMFTQYALENNTAYTAKHVFAKISVSSYTATSESLSVDSTTGSVTNFFNPGAFSLLLDDRFTVDTATLSYSGLNGTNYHYKGSTFYFLGKTYTQSVVTSIPAANQNFIGKSITIQGIKKPELSQLINPANNQFKYEGLVYAATGGFSTASTAFSNLSYTVLNNLLTTVSNKIYSQTPVFGVTLSTSTGWTVSYSTTGEEFFKNDTKSSSIVATITSPIDAPKGASISFNLASANIRNKTVCGIETSTGSVDMCSRSSDTFSCVNPTAGNGLKVCCFNLNHTSAGTESIGLASASLTLDRSQATTSQQNTVISSISTISSRYSVTSSEASKPVLRSITYHESSYTEAFGVAVLKIELKMNLKINSKLVIEGDFSKLVPYSNTTVQCIATTSPSLALNSPLTGDFLIDNCKMLSFNSTRGFLEVQTRNNIFSCTNNYSNILYITLTPVRVVAFSTTSGTTTTYQKFKVSTFINGNSFPISEDTSTRFLQMETSTNSKLIIADKSTTSTSTLCNVGVVEPDISAGKAKISLNFAYASHLSTFTTNNEFPNHYSVYIPVEFFGQIPEGPCLVGIPEATEATCYVNKFNFISIYLKTNLVVSSSSSTIAVGLDNIPLPRVATASNIEFLCSMDVLSTSNDKKPLVVGRGLYASTIPKNTITQRGALSFINTVTGSNLAYPRENISSLTFQLGIHKFGLAKDFSYSINNYPAMAFVFPPSYEFLKYGNTNVDFQIEEFRLKDGKLDSKMITSNLSKTFGNTFVVELVADVTSTGGAASTYTFSSDIAYFQVKVSNVAPPSDAVSNMGQIQVYFTNLQYTYLFETTAQNNNLCADNQNNTISSCNRGFKYAFREASWQIDIEKEGLGVKELEVNPGFFSDYTFRVKKSEKNILLGASVKIKVNNANFTLQAKNTANQSSDGVIINSTDEFVDFELGLACGQPLGSYVLKFISSINDTFKESVFTPIEAIIVRAVYAQPQVNCVLTSSSVPINTNYPFKCTISKKTVSTLSLSFVGNSTNSNTSKITASVNSDTLTELEATFSVTGTSSLALPQRFTVSSPSSCYSVSPELISIDISNPDIMPTVSETDLTDRFYFKDSSDGSLLLNQLEVVYVPVSKYVAVNCALTCVAQTFPTEDSIKSLSGISTSIILKTFSFTVQEESEVSSKIFNLKRNVAYKMKCGVMQNNTTMGEAKFKEFTELPKSNLGGEKQAISLKSVVIPESVILQTDKALTEEQSRKLVNLCQNTFSFTGSKTTSRIICTDAATKLFGIGKSLNTNVCNTTVNTLSTTTTALRYLQDTLPTDQSSTPASQSSTELSALTITAVSDPLSPYEVSVEELRGKFAEFADQINTKEKVNSLISTEIATFNLIQIQDKDVPTFEPNNQFTLGNATLNYNGTFDISISFDDYYICRYMILPSDTKDVTVLTLKNCATGLICGEFESKKTVETQIKSDTELKLVREKEFTFFLTCEIAVTQSNFSSNVVVEAYKTKIPAPNKEGCAANDPNPDEDGCFCFAADNSIVEAKDGACATFFVSVSLFVLLSLFI